MRLEGLFRFVFQRVIEEYRHKRIKTKCLHGFILGLHFGGIVVSLLCDSFYLGTVVLNRLIAESS